VSYERVTFTLPCGGKRTVILSGITETHDG
jgi:hypothetical protein